MRSLELGEPGEVGEGPQRVVEGHRGRVIGGHRTIELEDVFRLMQSGSKWMIYTGSRYGTVRKIGPATFRPGEQAKVLFRLNGRAMKLANVEDLLLRFPASGQ